MLSFSGSYVALTIKTGIMTGILSLTVREMKRFGFEYPACS
jgi:hypothetical protein